MTIQDFLEFTFQSFWTFSGMILLMIATGGLIRNLFSFIPKRMHFGGEQTVIEHQVVQAIEEDKKSEK